MYVSRISHPYIYNRRSWYSSVRRARIIMGDAVYALFDSVTPATEPLHRPTAGTNCLYMWNDETTKNDWHAGGYRWRQNGNTTLKIFHVRRPTVTCFVHLTLITTSNKKLAQLMLTYPRRATA